MGAFAAGQRYHLVSAPDDARGHFPAETAEVEVGPQHVLHGEAEVVQVVVVADVYGFEMIQQARAFVPRCASGLLHHIVAFEGGQGDALYVGDAERRHEGTEISDDAVKHFAREIQQVHLVHRQYDMPDAQQGAEERVAACLGDDARTGIHQNDGQIGCRAACDHVPRVLLVARGVGYDELAFVGREVAVGHVDGDALFAFGFQTVEQQGVVNVLAGVAHALRVAFECGELVLVEFFRVEEQPSYECAFSVVYTAGGEKAEQVLLLVPVKVFLDGKFLAVGFRGRSIGVVDDRHTYSIKSRIMFRASRRLQGQS